eukprot:scaffold144636_cov148-Phaeocystis_antarctica.AAC.1
MEYMFYVRSTACPAPQPLQSEPYSGRCLRHSTALPPAGPHLAPRRMPSFRLGRTRRHSTSR